MLVAHFVREWSCEYMQPVPEDGRCNDGALELLLRHDFPGNVRELRNLVRRALCLHGNPLTAAAVAEELAQCGGTMTLKAPESVTLASETLGSCPTPTDGVLVLQGRRWPQIEGAIFKYALQESGGNYRGAARLLGISRSTFNDRARRMGI